MLEGRMLPAQRVSSRSTTDSVSLNRSMARTMDRQADGTFQPADEFSGRPSIVGATSATTVTRGPGDGSGW